MTAKELTIALTGREVGMEIMPGEERATKDASDDNVEFSGAIDDEVGAYEGTTVYLTPAGVLQEPDCGRDDCPYFAKEREKVLASKLDQAIHDLHFVMADGDGLHGACKNKCLMGTADACKPCWKGLDD